MMWMQPVKLLIFLYDSLSGLVKRRGDFGSCKGGAGGGNFFAEKDFRELNGSPVGGTQFRLYCDYWEHGSGKPGIE